MFYLYQSDRLEALAEMCAHSSGLAFGCGIGTGRSGGAEPGMRRYLNVFFARKLGVAAT